MDILKSKKLILASNSPRRSELLTMAKIPFEKRVKDVEEIYPEEMEISAIPAFLARLKAKVFKGTLNNNEIVLTADTIVTLDNQVLGKPKDFEQAKAYLELMSGNTHKVITAFNLLSNEKEESFTDTAIVQFYDLSSEEIDWYIKTYEPYDKAGAYGIQDWIGYVKIKEIEGSYATIMGLPISMVYQELERF